MVSIVLGVIALLLDQILKFWTVANLDLNTGIKDLPGFVRLTYIKNFGAAFGVLKDAAWLRWLALILLLVFTAAVLLGLKKRIIRSGFSRFTGIMLLAGLLGNGIDRAIYGYVVDMFEFKFGVGSLPIFNLADVLILVFGILFCVSIFIGGLDFSRSESESFAERNAYDEAPSRRVRKAADEEYEAPVRARARAVQEEAPAARRVRSEEAAPVRRTPVEEDPFPTRVRRPITEAEIHPVRVARPSAQAVAPNAAANSVARPAAAQAPAPRPAASRPAPATVSAAKPAATAARPATRPAAPTATAAKPVAPTAANRPVAHPTAAPTRPASAVSPASQAATAARPAARPASKPVEDEFDLESILAEFK